MHLIQTIVYEFHTWISASLTRNELHSSAVPSATICHSIYLLGHCNLNCSIRYLPTHLPLSSFSYCAFFIHYCSGNFNCAFNASIHSSYICLQQCWTSKMSDCIILFHPFYIITFIVNLQSIEFNAASSIYSFKLETMLLILVNAFPKSVLAPISIKDFKSQRLQYALMCELCSLPSTHHGMNRLLKLHIRS